VKPKSSDPSEALDDTSLAVLVACHHRGPLSEAELKRLLQASSSLSEQLEQLTINRLLESRGGRYAVGATGRQILDQTLERIEESLAPEDPAYVRRYRREEPTLPFAANSIWAEAICVNMRVEPDALRSVVPDVFDLDLYDGTGFVSLTASRLKNFGTGKLPSALRMNFYQATYRAHVIYRDFRNRPMRGCYFVRSETNSHLMSLAANLLPEFRSHHCATYPILMVKEGDRSILTVDSYEDPAGKVVLVLDGSEVLQSMPETSVFPSIDAAYSYIVDFYDAFAYEPSTREVFILRIERGDWKIQVVKPVDYYLGYFTQGPFPEGSCRLDSVFRFRDVPYRWLPLLKERIKLR